MRKLILLLNLAAAVAFFFVGATGIGRSQSSVHTIYRQLETDGVFAGSPRDPETGEVLHVRENLMKIARANHQSMLVEMGIVACLLNGLVYFFSGRRGVGADNSTRSLTSSPQTHPSSPPSG